MISYAQNFEDVMLARVFAGRDNGFYVDVGAGDPVNLSVTKWFYNLGWSGLNIEPNKQLFDRLAADRSRDINLNCGAGATASEAQFFEPDVGELSSFDFRVQDKAQSTGVPGSTRIVAVAPLTDLLKLHCPGRAIDFLKIDVEGWEAEVLRGLDLRQYRPIVILIEATIPQTRIESHMEWEPGVLSANYSFVYFDGVNRFYLANEHADLKKHFTSPPNAFDEFETFPLVRAKTDAEQRLEAMHKLERFIQERDAVIKESDAVIKGSDAVIKERDAVIKERDAVIKERDAAIKERDAVIEGRDAVIEERDAVIKERDAVIEERDAVIKERDAVIKESDAVISRIFNSRIWKLTHPKWLARFRVSMR